MWQVNDKIDEDIARYFDDVADFIYEVANTDGRVLIRESFSRCWWRRASHLLSLIICSDCMAGISRSAAFVLGIDQPLFQ